MADSTRLFRFAVLAALSTGCNEDPAQEDDFVPCETDHECDGLHSGVSDTHVITTGEDSSTGEDPPQGGEVPCDVKLALASNCGSCHGEMPMFGAPMALTRVDDFLLPTVTDPASSVSDTVLTRISDSERPMPPDGSMSGDDADVIANWIADGMPAYDGPECADAPPDEEPWGPEHLPCEPSVEFLAHAEAGENGGFEVPPVDDLYRCFVFDSPFNGDEQGTAWAPVIDDARVVHHWLMMRSSDTSLEAGTVVPCGQDISLTSTMLMGWAPGTGNFVMPDEAGLELPGPDEKIILQIHYNNTAGFDDAVDKSGVAVCTTPEPRENAASTLWLGSLEIDVPAGGKQTVVSDCHTGLRIDEPVTMLLSWPHMHEVGSSIKTELIEQGNTDNIRTLVDVPSWNFENQIYYPHTPAVEILPGDVLRTTCKYDNPHDYPVRFGEGTGDEMCFDFSIVYPITAFDFPNEIGPDELGRYCVAFGDSIPFP